MNTIHMSKNTLTDCQFLVRLKHLVRRAACAVRGERYNPAPGPQWQQLELPFSRTPLKRWNR